MSKIPKQRRTFLKQAGAVGLAGGLGTFAGCAGGDGGDGGGDGGDGGSDGGDGGDGGSTGDGGDGGGGGIEDRDTIRLVIPPLGYNMVALGYIRDSTNVLANEMDAVGYDYDITISWDDSTLFAAGGADTVPTLGDIECAQIAVQRDRDIAMHGLCALNYEGIYVRRGEDLDPDNTGSVEASIRKLVDEGRRFGNAGWNQGEVPCGQITFNDKYGLIYTQDGGDFNVFSADWFTLPQLLIDGEVDMIVNAPPLGAASEVAKGEDNPIKDILWYQPSLEDAGLDSRTMNLGMWPTTPEFSEHHSDALAAFMRAWVEGIEYLNDPANADEIVSNEDYIQALGGNNEAEARVILEFGTQPGSHIDTEPGNNRAIMQSEIEFTDEFIEMDKQALEAVTGDPFNLVPDGWQDRLEYKKLSL